MTTEVHGYTDRNIDRDLDSTLRGFSDAENIFLSGIQIFFMSNVSFKVFDCFFVRFLYNATKKARKGACCNVALYLHSTGS